MKIKERVESLRASLREKGLQGCVIPNSDPHMSEYIPNCWTARKWYSGFTGSAGTLVVLQNWAGLWTDSRYFLQGEMQLAGSGIELMKVGLPDTPSMLDQIGATLQAGDRLLIPGLLTPVAEVRRSKEQLSKKGIEVVTTPIEAILAPWAERPSMPESPLYLQFERFSGASAAERIEQVRKELDRQGADCMVVTDLAEIGWMLNVRGSDVESNPVALAYALVSKQETIYFVHPQKISEEVANYLRQQGVLCADYDRFFPYLQQLGSGVKVMVDVARANQSIYDTLQQGGSQIIEGTSPIVLLKAVKNSTEIEGFREAMIKDGVALTRFFRWLEQHVDSGESEYTISERLLAFREEQPLFVGESFATIAGYQANGAIVHYHCSKEDSATLRPEGMLLLDSGGQYFDGTTDITRTVALGEPTEAQKVDYTLVLKGHIAIATALFPQGTRGSQLDILARKAMWDRGINYGHGTGHGIGHFMNVHEGPQNIRMDENPTQLVPGMVLSNEPGMYRAQQYGIRIENLILVEKRMESEFAAFYGFETLTLFPYDRTLIDRTLLTSEEIDYVNRYHQRVYDLISPRLNAEEQQWLQQKCAAI